MPRDDRRRGRGDDDLTPPQQPTDSRSVTLRPRGTLFGMDKQAVKRRVRIAVSVFFILLSVAFCVLWWRSYRWADCLTVRSGSYNSYQVESVEGEFRTCHFPRAVTKRMSLV